MPGIHQPDFHPFELEQGLLNTHFRVHTKWHVITGAPSCGKTTLINLLSDKGFQTAPEGARIYLEQETARGRSLKEIRSDQAICQTKIKDMQLVIEDGLNTNECVFLDRAIPDCLAWYRVFGLDPNQMLPDCFHYRYASVFLLDPLPLHQNGFRYKYSTLQGFTDEWHARDYNALGYDVTRVPVIPPEGRLSFVLQKLSEKGFM